MIEANIPLIYYFADRFSRGRSKMSDSTFDDLIGYGCVGLIEAVDEYDPERGHQFSTFARYRITRYFLVAMHEDADLIHTSINYNSQKYRSMRNPEHMEAFNLARSYSYAIQDDAKFEEVDLCEEASRLELESVLRECVESLDPAERKVIKACYFSDKGERTRKDIAKRLGYSLFSLNAILERAKTNLWQSAKLRAAI